MTDYCSPADCALSGEHTLLSRYHSPQLHGLFACLWYGDMSQLEDYFSKNMCLYINNSVRYGATRAREWFSIVHPSLIKIKMDMLNEKIIMISNDYLYLIKDINHDNIQVLVSKVNPVS